MKRRDADTIDLFRDYAPPPVVARFPPERVRAAKCSARIARAVAEAIKESKHSRDVIAQLMADYLGEHITVSMLDQYTSTANDKSNIPAHRLVALIAVTNDVRIINAMLTDTDMIAVPAKYEALIRREVAKDVRDRLDREICAADTEWRARR